MKDRIGPLLLAAGVAVLVLTGWRVFFFLTDDAFIAFRYASNSMLGYGLVWNPPPFQPVEGYTSWLWVVLLRWVWWLTGAQPPLAANYLALACGCATLVVGALLVREVALPDRLARVRLALLALVLLGTATNRTFLAWLSSGLETALFNLCVTFWIYQALRRSRPLERRRIFWLSMGAAASALTRPDGLLFVAATIVLVGIDLLEAPGSMRTRVRRAVWSFPLLLPVVHLFWRRAKYGEWLPNTYYAKHLAPWPESGVRYLAAFVLEYALWFWVALVLAWSVVWALQSRRIDPKALVVMGAVLGQVGYYTLQIGGDHFEYRVYSHLILLILVSTVWLLARLDLRPAVALLALGSFVMVSWPVPWVHWWETRDLRTRKETLFMVRPIAERFPTPLRSYV
ncbi:MAG: hypothetical protein O7A09_00240, partial [Proteobacteria bacterium]|nr:hypothetical protein [Pseudomonadota bacterium]